jgi:ABC-type cobalamin/Fe3+-siderophores transport system ATPase subunit
MFLKEGKVKALGEPEKLITKENIKEVFEADVEIRENIHSKLPEISLIPKEGEKS